MRLKRINLNERCTSQTGRMHAKYVFAHNKRMLHDTLVVMHYLVATPNHLIFTFLIHAAESSEFVMHACFPCSFADDMGTNDFRKGTWPGYDIHASTYYLDQH